MRKDTTTLVGWMNDAYAMQHSIIEMLQAHAADARELPDLHSALERYIEQTRSQAERLSDAIAMAGGRASHDKEKMGRLLGRLEIMKEETSGDKVLRNTLMEESVFRYQLSAFSAISQAADILGERDIVRIVDELIAEQRRSADEVEARLPGLVHQFMAGGSGGKAGFEAAS